MRIDARDIEDRAKGRWRHILISIGISEMYLTGKHGPCIFCNGRDRWRWDNKDNRGSYLCNQCGSGWGIQLVQKHLGINFRKALKVINEILGGGNVQAETPIGNKITIADTKIMLNKIWTEAQELTGSDHASKYLHARKLNLTPNNIKYHPSLYHSGTKKEYPAMVARIVNASGTPIAIHRIYLDADIAPNKMLTPVTEPLNGSAIRLFEPGGMFEKNVLGIAEGACTAMACTQIFLVATWSAISSTLMDSWEPPKNIKRVIIFSDRDASYVGQAAAYSLAKKLAAKDIIVETQMPDIVGDFNDILINTIERTA